MVSIERFAELRRAMEAGEPRDDVLRREGLSVGAWLAVQRRWVRALAGEARRGEH
ncbi:MAG: hypothetical protein HY908_19105, partial [Myxococcales bacterium]|nr:hypothetical protein [Myxococcales bacterium]